MVLLATKPKGADGARAERVLEIINIACNKNTLPSGTFPPQSMSPSEHFLTNRHKRNQPWGNPSRFTRHDNKGFPRARIRQDRRIHRSSYQGRCRDPVFSSEGGKQVEGLEGKNW